MQNKLKNLCIIFFIFVSTKSFSQKSLSDRDTLWFESPNWNVSNLSRYKYSVSPNEEKLKLSITANGANSDTKEEGDGKISAEADVNLERGEIVFSGSLKILSKDFNELLSAGTYVQAINQEGNYVAVGFSKDWVIVREDSLVNFKIAIPFNTPIKKIVWGVYAQGEYEIEAYDLQMFIWGGEFSNLWIKEYEERVINNNILVNELAKLCKLWGFLKYFYPLSDKDILNWDNELISSIDDMINPHDQPDYNSIYLDLLEKVDVLKINNNIDDLRFEDTLSNQGTDWIDNDNFEEDIVQNLKLIEYRNLNFDNFFVTVSDQGTPNPQFTNEKTYGRQLLPSSHYRLLALFRYWNIINYFYPYKYSIKDNWNSILLKFIPIFFKAKTLEDYKSAILLLNAKISDTHALNIQGINNHELPYLLSHKDLRNNFVLLPLQFYSINNRFYIQSIDEDFGKLLDISLGDEVVELNGISLSGSNAEYSKYLSASNRKFKNYYINKLNLHSYSILENEDSLHVKIVRDGKEKLSKFKFDSSFYYDFYKAMFQDQYPVEDTLRMSLKYYSDSVLYIDPSLVKSTQIDSLISGLEKIDFLVIDFRKYPKMIFRELLPYLIKDGEPKVQFQWINLQRPGTMESPVIDVIEKNTSGFKGKLILIIDENSLSRSEYFAMLFEQTSADALMIGRPTAGATGDRSEFPIPGGYVISYSGIRVTYGDGSEIFGNGLEPDVIVDKRISDIVSGNDEILDFILTKMLN